MTWMHRLRLKVLAIALGLALTAIALISLTTIPAWPIVGVAFAATAFVVNQMSSRLSGVVCHGCGSDIQGVPGGQYGVTCPKCGHLTQHLAFGPAPDKTPDAPTTEPEETHEA